MKCSRGPVSVVLVVLLVAVIAAAPLAPAEPPAGQVTWAIGVSVPPAWFFSISKQHAHAGTFGGAGEEFDGAFFFLRLVDRANGQVAHPPAQSDLGEVVVVGVNARPTRKEGAQEQGNF